MRMIALVQRNFHEKRLYEHGITCRFVPDNQANSKRAGTLRDAFPASARARPSWLPSCEGESSMSPWISARLAQFGKHVLTELSAESGRQL